MTEDPKDNGTKDAPAGTGKSRRKKNPFGGKSRPRTKARTRAKPAPPAAEEAATDAGEPAEKPVAVPQSETAVEAVPVPAPPRRLSATVVFLGAVLLLATFLGAAYATWPLWSPRVSEMLPPGLRDPFEDPRIIAMADRLKAIEEMTKARDTAADAIMDLEAERARFREQLTALIERVEGQEEALASVRKLVATAVADTETAADADETGKSLRQLSERLQRLEESGSDNVSELGRMETRNEELSKVITEIAGRVGTLEKAEPARDDTVEGALAVVLAVAQLRETLRTRAPFTDDLEALKAVAGDDQGIARAIGVLEPYASVGIPTLEELRRRFAEVAPEIVRASYAPEGGGWVERAIDRVASLVSVRRVGGGEANEGVDAAVTMAEANLETGDLRIATEALEGLTGKSAKAALPWLDDAGARLTAERALAALHVNAISMLAPSGE